MNIILFGPPGVGKSTKIGYLKLQGQKAIDLEDLYPNRLRFKIPDVVDETFIGGADLDPKRKYRNCKKVLLLMNQREYEQRRAVRDIHHPEKASQSKHLMKDWLSSTSYDLIVSPDMVNEHGIVADEIAVLINYMRAINGK